jgi:hypothetical protein
MNSGNNILPTLRYFKVGQQLTTESLRVLQSLNRNNTEFFLLKTRSSTRRDSVLVYNFPNRVHDWTLNELLILLYFGYFFDSLLYIAIGNVISIVFSCFVQGVIGISFCWYFCLNDVDDYRDQLLHVFSIVYRCISSKDQ